MISILSLNTERKLRRLLSPAMYRYDVLPDRLIAYVWPRASGTRFDFKFHLRYGINAKTPPSILYDYYNPDAQVTVKPVRFKAK